MSGIKHFCSWLDGRPFLLWTDHKPLIFALHGVSLPTSGCHECHLAFISEYTNQLVYVPGTSNVVADELSRPAVAAAGTVPVCAAIADITQKVGDLDLIGDSSTSIFHPLVPRDLR
jgi:hypothetical protein